MRTYTFDARPHQVSVVYELKPGAHFVNKKITIAAPAGVEFQVKGLVEVLEVASVRITDESVRC